jgi:hypothetical protein
MNRAERSAVSVLLGVAVLVVPLGGCSGQECLPEPLRAQPSTVASGSDVRLSALAASCDLGYQKGGTTYTAILGGVEFDETYDLGSFPVAADGSFETTLRIPEAVPPGSATVMVQGSPFDDCDDGGSCVGYSTDIEIAAR